MTDQPAPDVLVLGAGITGVAAAETLRRMGRRPLLIDRGEPGGRGQTSFGNAGLLARCAIEPVSEPGLALRAPFMLLDRDAPLFLRLPYLPRLAPWLVRFLLNGRRARNEALTEAIAALTTSSVDEHLALARGTAAERYIRRGDYAYLHETPALRAAAMPHYEARAKFGLACRALTGEEMRERAPGLGLPEACGVAFPDHGWLTSPGGYVAALAAHYRAAGGAFLQAEVADLRPVEGGVEVTLAGGKALRAPHAVVATGAWSKKLTQGLTPTPLETERGYHLMLKNPSRMPRHPVMVAEAAFVMTPMEEGLRCAGIVELGGLDAPMRDGPPALLRRVLRRVMPDLTWEGEEVWMGHRPSFPDSLPMLGPAPGAERVIFAFGGQHVGLTIGPLLGRLAAGFAAGERPNIDLSAVAPGRFRR